MALPLRGPLTAFCVAIFVLPMLGSMHTRPQAGTEDGPFPVEYYYKVRWGHFDEFLELYQKNHYPILQRLQEQGEILEMSAVSPFYHAGEGARWDFRFTIVWKNASVAHDLDADREPILQELYPDRATFAAEEQRRFELLEEHMDVPIVVHDIAEW